LTAAAALAAAYRLMVRIRAFETKLLDLAEQGQVPGVLHTCRGQEAPAAALGLLREPADQVTATHRGHGVALGLGVDPVALACEMLGRSGGLTAGRGGPKHLSAPEHGLLMTQAIVGAGVPLAAGAALAAKRKGTGGIGIAVTGEGAMNQGAVLETLNLAPVLGLPLIILVEANGFAQTTAAAYAHAGVPLAERARGFGWQARALDGQDAGAIMAQLADLMAAVRQGGPPAFLSVSVPRLDGYFSRDQQPYRRPAAIAADRARDPLPLLARQVRDAVMIEAEETARIEAAFAQACGAPPVYVAEGWACRV